MTLRRIYTVSPLYPWMRNPRRQKAICTLQFYLRDLSICRFWYHRRVLEPNTLQILKDDCLTFFSRETPAFIHSYPPYKLGSRAGTWESVWALFNEWKKEVLRNDGTFLSQGQLREQESLSSGWKQSGTWYSIKSERAGVNFRLSHLLSLWLWRDNLNIQASVSSPVK